MGLKPLLVTVMAASAMVSVAEAQTYRVTYTAQADQPTGIIGGVNPSPITSSISAGDVITATLEYDISKASVTSLYDADPTTNIYSIPMTYSYTVGSYSSGIQKVSDGYLQIWNNRFISSYSPNVDNYSFGSLYRYLPNGSSPVAIGAGQIFSGLSLYAFDSTGTKLDNDLITAIPNYTGWNLGLEFAFLNTSTNDFALIRGMNVQATISQISGAVPEPATWAMMLTGFAMVGGAVRYRRRTTKIAYA